MVRRGREVRRRESAATVEDEPRRAVCDVLDKACEEAFMTFKETARRGGLALRRPLSKSSYPRTNSSA